MSTPEPAPTDQTSASADLVAALLRDVPASQLADGLPDRTVQQLLTAAIKLYVAKREAGTTIPPFADDELTATEVVVTASNLLKAANLEVFELTMWNGFGTM